MPSDFKCSACSATFSRSEHLRRHAISHDGDRPHACEFCGARFNRKDVLRRHEKTCRARCPSALDDCSDFQENAGIREDRESKRYRVSSNTSNIKGLDSASEAVIEPSIMSHAPPLEESSRESELEDATDPRIEFNEGYHTWISDGLLSSNMPSQIGNTLSDGPSLLDFSAFDSILFPQKSSDLFLAERLEFMAYFTSSQGMRTFTDRETFRQRQEMAREAYETQSPRLRRVKDDMSLANSPKPEKKSLSSEQSDLNSLQAKSCELVESLRDVISNKKNDNVITLEWTSDISQLCADFFQPSNLCRFLEYFWSLWYPHCPIVHRPLFNPISASPELLCVMITIGACLSPEENDNEASRKWLDSIEELIFRQVYFQNERENSLNQPGQRKDIVQCMQAAYLVSSLQKREGSAEAQARIRRHRHASMVTLVRYVGSKKASHRHLELADASDTWWRQFAEDEELIRTIIFIFLIDAALTILHNSPPRMVVPELKMEVACPEFCFQAESASECLKHLQGWSETRFWKNRLSIVSVVRRICQSPIEESLTQDYARLGTLNLFTVVQAIHSLMFQLHNSLVFESTLAPIQTGLENWRQIWNMRVPADTGIPDIPGNLWKQVGFLGHASEFWQLARLLMGKIMAANEEDGNNAEEIGRLSRYDHTDMGEVNGLIMEYRRLNLGVN